MWAQCSKNNLLLWFLFFFVFPGALQLERKGTTGSGDGGGVEGGKGEAGIKENSKMINRKICGFIFFLPGKKKKKAIYVLKDYKKLDFFSFTFKNKKATLNYSTKKKIILLLL